MVNDVMRYDCLSFYTLSFCDVDMLEIYAGVVTTTLFRFSVLTMRPCSIYPPIASPDIDRQDCQKCFWKCKYLIDPSIYIRTKEKVGSQFLI